MIARFTSFLAVVQDSDEKMQLILQSLLYRFAGKLSIAEREKIHGFRKKDVQFVLHIFGKKGLNQSMGQAMVVMAASATWRASARPYCTATFTLDSTMLA